MDRHVKNTSKSENLRFNLLEEIESEQQIKVKVGGKSECSLKVCGCSLVKEISEW